MLRGITDVIQQTDQVPFILVCAVLGLGAFIVVLAHLAARQVLRPVGRLVAAAQRIAEGDLHVRLAPTGVDELTDLVDMFNDMALSLEKNVGRLRRLEARARRFAGDVSHELRTPLAAMIAVTDLLDERADSLDPDASTAARLVSQETRNLNRLVSDLIEISRFDAGTVALVPDSVNLAEAVGKCVASRGWADQVETELPPNLVVRLDPRRLDVIIANLVGNALRHGAAPVSVCASAQVTGSRTWLSIRVSDCGPGLSAEVLPHVFERFYKADTARSRSAGSGLGLAIAMENARLHGGMIEAGNQPSGGAVFTVGLPV